MSRVDSAVCLWLPPVRSDHSTLLALRTSVSLFRLRHRLQAEVARSQSACARDFSQQNSVRSEHVYHDLVLASAPVDGLLAFEAY